MVKAKQRSPRRTKNTISVKDGEAYDVELYEDKPNCPQCGIRDYKFKVGKTDNGFIKMYATCNKCGKKFIYYKSLSVVFGGNKEDNNNEICKPGTD